MNQTFGRSEAVAKLVETVHFRYTTDSLLTLQPRPPNHALPTTPSQPRPPSHALRQHPLVRWRKRTEASAPTHRIRGSQAKQRLLVYSTAAASVTASLSPPPAAPSAAGAGSDQLAPMRPRRGPIRQLVANPSSFGERRCWAGSGPTLGAWVPSSSASFSRCCCTRGRSVKGRSDMLRCAHPNLTKSSAPRVCAPCP
jgi:hypothetical protein